MLSIGKLAAGPGAGRYYEDGLANGREDYYAEGGQSAGAWVGRASRGLGLIGDVESGQIEQLLAGEHPRSGERLGRAMGAGSVAGFDLTFKAPKSVSILCGISRRDLAEQLVAAHDAAVREALDYLERTSCFGRRGTDGVVQVKASGYLAAGFRHMTSRAGDPLVHTHVVIANRVQGPDGRWTAPDARHLYREGKTAGFLYQAVIRAELTERLGLEWTLVDKGTADVAGVPRDVIDHFSRRRAEIVAEMARQGSHSLIGAQTAALATRRGKDYGVTPGRLRDEWRARAAERGLGRDEIASILTGRERTPAEPTPVEPAELTAEVSTFARRDVLRAIASSFRDGANISEIEAAADQLLAREDVVAGLDRNGGAGVHDARAARARTLAARCGR